MDGWMDGLPRFVANKSVTSPQCCNY